MRRIRRTIRTGGVVSRRFIRFCLLADSVEARGQSVTATRTTLLPKGGSVSVVVTLGYYTATINVWHWDANGKGTHRFAGVKALQHTRRKDE